MKRTTYEIEIWGGPSHEELSAPTPEEMQAIVAFGLRRNFVLKAEQVTMLKDEPQRIAYQGVEIGKQLERAMWLSVCSIGVKKVEEGKA